MRLLLLLLALGLAFVLWPRPTEAPKEAGVRLYGVAFHLFPEEEGVEWRFRAEEMVEEEEVGLSDDLTSSLYFNQDQQKRVDFILGNSPVLHWIYFSVFSF